MKLKINLFQRTKRENLEFREVYRLYSKKVTGFILDKLYYLIIFIRLLLNCYKFYIGFGGSSNSNGSINELVLVVT